MNKYTKSYIEKKISSGFFFDFETSEVEERNPFKVQLDNRIVGFRFYDVDYIIDNGKVHQSEPYNYTGWILFGFRYTYEDIIKMYKNNKKYDILIGNMQRNNINEVCKTFNGSFIPIGENDMTHEELMHQKEKTK